MQFDKTWQTKNKSVVHKYLLTEMSTSDVSVARILKWVSGGLEAALGIPVVGGTIIISLAWTPLLITLISCSAFKPR